MTIMTNDTQYNNLTDFLAKHTANAKAGEGGVITHTRIGSTDLQIYGGKYIIPQDELPRFYELYYDYIYNKCKKEYLTEKQMGLAMAVDFDFRYNNDVTTRQHSAEHICDMICEYLTVLKSCFVFNVDTKFDVYVFEKPNVNTTSKDITKDGIHMLIGLQVDFVMQTLIREKMLAILPNIWDNLPIVNSWDSVLDAGISKGDTNWQLYGSRKPGNEAYELTHHFVITLDPADNEFQMDEQNVKHFNLKDNFAKLSVQYNKHPKLNVNPKIMDEYNKRSQTPKIKKPKTGVKVRVIDEEDAEEEEGEISLNDIKDKETLDKAIDIMLRKFKHIDRKLYELHHFTQELPEKYYAPGSHQYNRQVAFALKHTDERLFLSWVKLRSKADDFDYNDIPNLYGLWKKFHLSNQEGKQVTKRSIIYWLQKDNREGYYRVKKTTTDYYLDMVFKSQTEVDTAILLDNLYGDEYVCVSYEKKCGVWYHFKNDRWRQDKGLTLRSKISDHLYELFAEKEDMYFAELKEYQGDENDNRKVYLNKLLKNIGEMKIRLKKTGFKDCVMREASEKMFDSEFIKNMDQNKFLMCFENGVVDFKNKVFREGYPEDCITKCTRINYIPYKEALETHKEAVEEIKLFLKRLFPIEDLHNYMVDHLASVLIGANQNQTFNVYHGSGSNGKSVLTDFMTAMLGDYKGVVPITLVTENRTKIGSHSDEIIKLKGVRYAVMQEPSKGVKLNEGIMKELTGGDPIQARGIWSESEVFDPQFSLVVCTNNLFDIESNDDGTWRRIRKCDFPSKFIDDGEEHNHDTHYVYLKDKTIKERFPKLAPILASMLVERVFETNGIVQDCETVMKASSKYRKTQDHINAFLKEKIVKTGLPSDRIKKTELVQEFKKWFEESQGSRKSATKGEELYEALNKMFKTTPKSTGWHGLKILYPQDEADPNEIAVQL
jgi:P4 family phage/plasmid primase-like protien